MGAKADSLNWFATVTESPVPKVAEVNVHRVAAVHAASWPIRKVPAAVEHA
jgi:hypothetical protein